MSSIFVMMEEDDLWRTLHMGDEAEEREEPSPLYQAAAAGDVEEVRRQLEAGLDLSADAGGRGETALHVAIKKSHKLVVELLLNAGHAVNCRCDDYYTPLHLAVDRDLLAVVEELLRRGASVDAQDSGDCTALHYAAEKGLLVTVELLLRHGASVDARCHGMVTPLHFAASRGYLGVVTLLLEAGADADCVNRMRQRPLHLAALSGRVDLALQLLRHGADLHAPDSEGRGPLHLACEYGHPDMTAFLLRAGADVDALTEDRATALELASRGRDPRCAVAVENHGAMLRAVHFRVSSPRLGDKADPDFLRRCQAEVGKMKAARGNGFGASVYDVLVSDVDRAAALLRNEALRTLLAQDLGELFPIYSALIGRVVKTASKRLALLDDAIDALEGLTHGQLPTEILREVTKYLHDEDLTRATLAYGDSNQ